MAMRLDRSLGARPQPGDQPDVEATIRRIGVAGIDAITVQALTDQASNGAHHHWGSFLECLWRHCLTTALLAQELARQLEFDPVEEAYIAGLLHDVGKLALSGRTPATCAALLDDPVQANLLLDAEAQVAGANHGHIGEWLIRRYTHAWSAADAARYHTAPASAVNSALPVVQIVWAANHLAVDPHPSSEACQTVARLLNLDPRELNHLAQSAGEQALSIRNELGIAPEAADNGQDNDNAPAPLWDELKSGPILSNVYRELLAATDTSGILRVLQQSLSVYLGIDALILFAHEPQKDLLVGTFTTGTALPDTPARLRIPLAAANSLPAICHRRGEPVDSFARTGQEALTIIDHQLIDYLGKDGIVCLPVAPAASAGGCLLFGIDGNHWPLLQKQGNLLLAIAGAVAGALDRDRRQQDQLNRQSADRHASTLERIRKTVHEINNPLSIIKNYLKVLASRTEAAPSGADEIRIINDEINRMAGLVKSLASPSAMAIQPIASVNVNATIADMLSLFRESLRGRPSIRLNQDLDESIPAIDSNRDSLKQILMNLLKNAAEAMPDGGTITVSTRMLTGPPRRTGGDDCIGRIRISVCDDGPGIDEKIQAKLFTPFVTSKADHDGLGLSIAHEAVVHLNGSLRCQSESVRGTCFLIELPLGGLGSTTASALNSAI